MFARIITGVAAAAFATIGLGFFFAPRSLGERFHLDAMGDAGTSALRADLGGLFIGLAALCFWGVRTRHRAAFIAAAVVLAAVVLGRTVSILAGDATADMVAPLTTELVALGGLAAYIRRPRTGDDTPRGASRRRVRTLLGATAAVLLLAVAALQVPSIQEWIFNRAAAQLTATSNTAPLADDALRVAICGSSAPLASEKRAKACVAVFADGKYWIVDAGPESVENLVLWNIPLADIGGVLLTHFHSDHIGDLGELNLQTWAQGRPAPLQVFGGPGIDQVVAGFNLAYRLDQGYRTAHHTDRMMPAATWPMEARTVELDGAWTPQKSRTAVVLDDGDLRITAIEVEHAPIEPAYAYRFDYRGRSVVITGDTKYHAPLAAAARGADVLISEAIARSMIETLEGGAETSGRDRVATIMHDIQDYHISPEEAARIANDAGVGLLVFYHLLPAPDAWLTRQLFARGVNEVREGRWDTADDGSMYTLPVGSNEVRIGRVTR